ncbi:YjjW family glycine radical enzyme activase [Clostridium oryzae]|uniref:Benzylsuccinate synthase activating enzyme n=1 Tax=Clostridium oryzae TaxID=1450648 RepID=A0A1V4IGX8_9CLOT|nr:YjjW family glycine radical enzyme activase [Clostridium oryzae]OPJ59186.1 benzylsuccinate synthase activating enzyme [Clostridium oryzae]
MENRAVVNRLIPFSNVDGPGNRFAIFFQQCNIQCIYCHNPETQSECKVCGKCVVNCPVKALTLVENKVVFDEKLCVECDTCIKNCVHQSSPRTHEYTVDELYTEIEGYKAFIRGITVSGGEPTLQAEFVTELFKKIKPLELTCFVDTNGFFDKDSNDMQKLIEVTDKFMVDIKAVDKIQELCGTNLKNNVDNLKYLLSLNKVYEVRTVIIEDYMDVENTLTTVASILKDYPNVNYKLITVHNSGLKDHQRELINDKIPTRERVEDLADMVRRIGVKKIEVI